MAAAADFGERNTAGNLCDGNGDPPYKMKREERFKLVSQMTFPLSHTVNTEKEETCIRFVANFRKQYLHLFPGRAPLLLTPDNENLKVQKFISTFIRPTLLPYQELYDDQSCASYVANYIRYDPLDDAHILPTRVVSPTTTLRWQVGNCVEMSILLCSLLLGAGYNAYVVVGYAHPRICENDQSLTPWPGSLPEEVNSDDEAAEALEKPTMYTKFLKRRPKLESIFDKVKAEEDRPKPKAARVEEDVETERVDRTLCHAWVLLRQGRRGLEQDKCVEPATGRIFSPAEADSRYFGVEAVFNHMNYFVNMQPELPLSEVSFDLYDLSNWEHVFLTDPELVGDDSPDGLRDKAKADVLTSDLGDGGDFIVDLPASWVGPLTLSREQYENRFPGQTKKVTYANFTTVEYFADYSHPELKVLEVKMPDPKTATGNIVHTFYKHRHDLLRRKSEYPALERNMGARLKHEWFLPGRKKEAQVEGLREMIEEPGVHRTMRFYWKARVDGLASRREEFFSDKDPLPRKILEHYRGRDEDRLIYRSATYEQQKETGSSMDRTGTLAAGTSTGRKTRNPISMSERFERNPAKEAQTDVAKRTFIKPLSPDGEIWVTYHYGKDCVTAPMRLFPRSAEKEKELGGGGDGGALQPRVVVMPFQAAPKASQLRDELRELIEAEKECLSAIEDRIGEGDDIMLARKKDTEGLTPIFSVYDTIRNRPKETEADREIQRAEDDRREKTRKDPLAPYIAALPCAKQHKGDFTNIKLSPEDAKQVRDSALKDLKERLIQRGHIMQARMDHEKEELNRKQQLYQKTSDDNGKEADNFRHELNQATQRMKILDKRLNNHIEQASEKYAKLAKDLAQDPRLEAIYEPPVGGAR